MYTNTQYNLKNACNAFTIIKGRKKWKTSKLTLQFIVIERWITGKKRLAKINNFVFQL